MLKMILGALFVCSVLTACEPNKLTALGGCSEASTVDLVRQVIQEHGRAVAGGNEADLAKVNASLRQGVGLSLTGIRTVQRDESVKKSACKAQLKIDVSQATIERMVLNIAGLEALASAGIQRAGDSLTADIDYAAQPTDDGKQVYVQVQAIGPVSRAVGLLAFAATMPQEAVSGGSGAVSSQVPRPTPPPPPAPAPIPVEPVQAQAPTAIQAQRLPTVPPTAAPASPALPVAPAPDDPLCTGLKTAVTSELLECIERRFVAADRDLNLEYKRAMGVLPPDRQATLRAEQRAWLKSFGPNCEAMAAKNGSGGTSATVIVADCRAQATQKRAAHLETIG